MGQVHVIRHHLDILLSTKVMNMYNWLARLARLLLHHVWMGLKRVVSIVHIIWLICKNVTTALSQKWEPLCTKILFQHHDSIVTAADLGLALNCQYDLSNRTILNDFDLVIVRVCFSQWTLKSNCSDPYKFCFYCSATHVMSQVMQAKSVKKCYRVRHTFISGQSYKQFTLVNYASRVVVTCKLLIFTTLDS